MATLFETIQFFDDAGHPLSNGLLYWYEANTSTLKNTWKDKAETSLHTNPIILDGDGRPPGGAIFIRGSYKLIIKDLYDVTLQTIDYINQYDQVDMTGLTATIADLNSTTTVTTTVSSVTTIALADRGKTILANAASAGFAINLPSSVSVGNKFVITIKKIDSSTNTVTITPNGAETIDGYTDHVLYDYNDFVSLHCDGSNWKVVAAESRGTIVTQTTSKTVNLGDEGKMFNCNSSSGAIIMSLPSSASVGRGFTLSFKKIDTGANTVTITPSGTETIDGQVNYVLDTQGQFITIKSDGANWYLLSEVSTGENFNLTNKISGLLLSNNAIQPTIKVDFAPGYFVDNGLNNIFRLPTIMVKDLSVAWAAGTGNGGKGFAAALANNTWYHCFVIAKVDGTVDAGFDTDVNATNLLAAASGYVYYRRITSIKTKNSTTDIIIFNMSYTHLGRYIQWSPAIVDTLTISAYNTDESHLVRSPLDVKLMADITANIDSYGSAPEETHMTISSLNVLTPAAVYFSVVAVNPDAHTYNGAASLIIQTDFTSKIRCRVNYSGSTAPTTKLITKGWYEND
jgi:hypothetical protein